MCVCVCVCVCEGGWQLSPAKINSLLWIEKVAILPVVLAASKFFFEANVVHPQPGIPVLEHKKENTTLHSQYISFFHNISFE